jgi:hypothetical protein
MLIAIQMLVTKRYQKYSVCIRDVQEGEQLEN